MKRGWKAVLSVLLLAVTVSLGFYLGRRTAPANSAVTFYAEIVSINDSVFMVEGLEVNDINHRGHFKFSVDEDTALSWRYADLAIEELQVGDTVSVTYTGSVRESDPAGIDNVTRIILLDDKK